MSAVRVNELTKVFRVPEREAGLRAATASLFRRKTRDVRAVDAVSFEIEPGEVVGFLGPNGAGKTTTLKMLSGLLYSSSGEATVLGHVPSKRERDYLRRMTLVMGNRNQLQWDLPALDSFELNRAIYRIPRPEFLQLRDELIELLDVDDLVRKPVRQLSLGERMKVEIVGSLLHRPQVLFLDEPTIGLDVTMQKRIRSFVAEYNRRYDATVLLDEPLHGRRRGALQARHRHPPRADPVRRRARPARRPLRRVEDDRGRPPERRRRPLRLRGGDRRERRARGPARPARRDGARDRPAARGAGRPGPDRRGPADRGRDRDRLLAGAPSDGAWQPEAGAGPLAARVLRRLRAHADPEPLPVPRRHVHVARRDAGGADRLPRRLDDDRRAAGRLGAGHLGGRVRRLLHHLDARPEHEHRLHAVRLGVADPRRGCSRRRSCGRCIRCTRTSRASPAGRS